MTTQTEPGVWAHKRQHKSPSFWVSYRPIVWGALVMGELGAEDWAEAFAGIGEDWAVVQRILPAGRAEAARRTGASTRGRGFDGPAPLLRALLTRLKDRSGRRQSVAARQAMGRRRDRNVDRRWRAFFPSGPLPAPHPTRSAAGGVKWR